MGYSLLLVSGEGADNLITDGRIVPYLALVGFDFASQAVEVEEEAGGFSIPFGPFLKLVGAGGCNLLVSCLTPEVSLLVSFSVLAKEMQIGSPL